MYIGNKGRYAMPTWVVYYAYVYTYVYVYVNVYVYFYHSTETLKEFSIC